MEIDNEEKEFFKSIDLENPLNEIEQNIKLLTATAQEKIDNKNTQIVSLIQKNTALENELISTKGEINAYESALRSGKERLLKLQNQVKIYIESMKGNK